MTSRPIRKPNKYGAIPTTVDGIRFASKREARHYSELKLRERAGEIRELELQPIYLLTIWHHPISEDHPLKCTTVGKYIADFRYWDVARNQRVVEDVKGMETQLFKLKKKLVEALYGMEIEIVK